MNIKGGGTVFILISLLHSRKLQRKRDASKKDNAKITPDIRALIRVQVVTYIHRNYSER